ncbi:hypothetical protein [Paenilisteria newyorkensis]|uniref:hypothetical protein n=1 Tax=Listeria newyorkensis TaxID=1497681 RepID=UPI000669E750|nr:hypothetical protein [Listeria newyorkensis]KMT62522.1 hypothetical protein X559_1060 [Listeria newyorkensis]
MFTFGAILATIFLFIFGVFLIWGLIQLFRKKSTRKPFLLSGISLAVAVVGIVLVFIYPAPPVTQSTAEKAESKTIKEDDKVKEASDQKKKAESEDKDKKEKQAAELKKTQALEESKKLKEQQAKEAELEKKKEAAELAKKQEQEKIALEEQKKKAAELEEKKKQEAKKKAATTPVPPADTVYGQLPKKKLTKRSSELYSDEKNGITYIVGDNNNIFQVEVDFDMALGINIEMDKSFLVEHAMDYMADDATLIQTKSDRDFVYESKKYKKKYDVLFVNDNDENIVTRVIVSKHM